MLLSYTDSIQYMIIDFSAISSQYGRFIPHKGFEMIHYPKLFYSSNGRYLFNPSFYSELASFIHLSVYQFLYPSIHNNLFTIEFQNSSRILQEGPLWDFGRVDLVIITIIEEIKDYDYNLYMAKESTNRIRFWESQMKSLQNMFPSQKEICLHPLFIPVSKLHSLSFILSENLELISSNNTLNRRDMHLRLRKAFITEILRHKDTIFEELEMQHVLNNDKQIVGNTMLLPVIM